MRIITGIARGIKLDSPTGTETRPTSDRVKEAIFSALHFELPDKRVLELFGGSGQLSLEALSRGALHADIIDNRRDCIEVIIRNANKTGLEDKCTVILSDWQNYLQKNKGRAIYDIVFLDPPYSHGLLDEIISAIMSAGILNRDARIVCESPKEGIPTPTENSKTKVYRYGNTYVTIIKLD